MSTKTHGQLLEPKLRSLEDKLSMSKFDSELFELIYLKGFTTPAEYFLIEKELELLHTLADMIQSRMVNILAASKKILNQTAATV